MTDRTLALLLFLLALLPRGLLLQENPPFWFDEDWTLEVGTLPPGQLLQALRTEDFHPPWATWSWGPGPASWGFSGWRGRYPSASSPSSWEAPWPPFFSSP